MMNKISENDILLIMSTTLPLRLIVKRGLASDSSQHVRGRRWLSPNGTYFSASRGGSD